MRKCCLESLPRDYRNYIDWKNSVGCIIDFIYDDINGTIEILDYIGKGSLKIIYNENIYEVCTDAITQCKLRNVIKNIKPQKKNHEDYYVGKIINNDFEEYEIINVDNYKSGGRRYHIKCKTCNTIRTCDINGIEKIILGNVKCNKCNKSKNAFKLSDDGLYWIGLTQKGEEFYFNGENSEYVKQYTWRKNVHGYFQNRKGEKLHRVVMGVTDRDIFVNHIGGNRFDCRIEMLSISNSSDNSKEKKLGNRNTSGIVGLMKRRNKGKYVGNIHVNGIPLYSKYKDYDEALIDLLIMQKHYGFRHNSNLYYMIDNISEDRINEVISNCERQLNAKRNDKVISTNKYKLSEDETFYWVYDDEGNKFKISLESKCLVEKGKWYVAFDRSNKEKTYVQGTIIVNNKRRTVKLHRYIMNLLEDKYKLYFVDHKNGDELDNRLDNLCITTPLGNGHKICNDTIQIRNNKCSTTYRVVKTIYGKKFDKTFKTKKEAGDYLLDIKEYIKNNQPHWKNKEELDEYLNNK